jgi:hypothetical protein
MEHAMEHWLLKDELLLIVVERLVLAWPYEYLST